MKTGLGAIAGLGIVALFVWLFLSRTPQAIAANTVSHADTGNLKKATFAGGCFWCMQPAYDEVPGVLKTTVGYTGGWAKNPTYEEVSSGSTGHAESIEILYDPSKVSYKKLLDVFWHNVDPTTKDREFCDVGHQYRTAIFFHDAEQEREARASEKEIEETKPFKDPIVTEIVQAEVFYPAEDYHQEFYKKNPVRYRYYRWGCGRDQRLRELWGAASGGH
jgi:peptide-methionine (S)-S-oxide reductase